MKDVATPIMERRLKRALYIGGDTHTLDDILDEIAKGQKQSFAEGDTWVVTQIEDYPRKRILQVFMVVGNMCNIDTLHQRVLQFAREVNADMLCANGRIGWKNKSVELGWSKVAEIYVRKL